MIIGFFAGTNFRGFVKKPRNPRYLIPLRYIEVKTSQLSIFNTLLTNNINFESLNREVLSICQFAKVHSFSQIFVSSPHQSFYDILKMK